MKIKHYILPILIVISTVACKPKCHDVSNPDCEDYDPCYGKNSTSAYFVKEEKLQNSDKWIECDSVNGVGNISLVRFRALNDADSFIWTLGSETIYTKSFTRLDFPQKTYIPVTLVAINKNPNKTCHPEDDGRDTFRRMMYTWGEEIIWDENKKGYVIVNPKPIQGVYTGYYESNPNKQVTIVMKDTVYSCSILQNNSNYGLAGYNLPEGYFQPTLDDTYCGYFGVGWQTHPVYARIGMRATKIKDYSNFEGDSTILVDGEMQLSRDLKNIEINFAYYYIWDIVDKKTIRRDKFIGRKIR